MNKILREMFLDYYNNYLTVALFAEHNGISEQDAQTLIDLGYKYHEEYVALTKRRQQK